mmetsp:Transcript_1016/g.3149  ORF Transcript_1016/g.3149 Transcript_1016/m.3149 type:complete len:331 (-) Transcript_1016:52-1044(-)
MRSHCGRGLVVLGLPDGVDLARQRHLVLRHAGRVVGMLISSSKLALQLLVVNLVLLVLVPPHLLGNVPGLRSADLLPAHELLRVPASLRQQPLGLRDLGLGRLPGLLDVLDGLQLVLGRPVHGRPDLQIRVAAHLVGRGHPLERQVLCVPLRGLHLLLVPLPDLLLLRRMLHGQRLAVVHARLAARLHIRGLGSCGLLRELEALLAARHDGLRVRLLGVSEAGPPRRLRARAQGPLARAGEGPGRGAGLEPVCTLGHAELTLNLVPDHLHLVQDLLLPGQRLIGSPPVIVRGLAQLVELPVLRTQERLALGLGAVLGEDEVPPLDLAARR